MSPVIKEVYPAREPFGLHFRRILPKQPQMGQTTSEPAGEYIFLEANPCGQWGWIEKQTGLPLTEALVDVLAAERTEE